MAQTPDEIVVTHRDYQYDYGVKIRDGVVVTEWVRIRVDYNPYKDASKDVMESHFQRTIWDCNCSYCIKRRDYHVQD